MTDFNVTPYVKVQSPFSGTSGDEPLLTTGAKAQMNIPIGRQADINIGADYGLMPGDSWGAGELLDKDNKGSSFAAGGNLGATVYSPTQAWQHSFGVEGEVLNVHGKEYNMKDDARVTDPDGDNTTIDVGAYYNLGYAIPDTGLKLNGGVGGGVSFNSAMTPIDGKEDKGGYALPSGKEGYFKAKAGVEWTIAQGNAGALSLVGGVESKWYLDQKQVTGSAFLGAKASF